MIRYALNDFCSLYRALILIYKDFDLAESLHVDQSPEYCQRVGVITEGLAFHCKQQEIDATLVAQIEDFTRSMVSDKPEVRSIVLKAQLRTIVDGVQRSLDSRLVYLVPQRRAPYINDFAYFGEYMHSLPDALMDFMEMRLCFAFGRHTACIFHAMRVAEYGLRQLAKRVNVSLRDNRKPLPVEYATWDKVIIGLENKIATLRKTAKSMKREEQLKFFASCTSNCAYMKDIYRNEVAHARRHYKEDEAAAAMSRVNDFMQTLSMGPNPPKLQSAGVRLPKPSSMLGSGTL